MKYLKRNAYIDQLNSLKNNNTIKLIQGIFSSGKTNIMLNFTDEIYHENPDANIIYYDFTHPYYCGIKKGKELVKDINVRYKEAADNYLILDEIQLCDDYLEGIKYIYDKKNIDIYVISSNILSESFLKYGYSENELFVIDVFPLSFHEYAALNEDFNDQDVLFQWYLKNGGFKYRYNLSDEHSKLDYISHIYSVITGYGLNPGYNIQDKSTLEKIQKYLIDSISKAVSPNRITDNLKARGISANHVTTGRYIKYLKDSFIFNEVKRMDLKTGTVLETMEKYYLTDLSLADQSLIKCKLDYGQIYENLVYIELKRRGYEVYTGKLYQKEIDFVAIKGNERFYIQIVDNIQNTDTVKEAVKTLIQIKDVWPKIIISAKCDEYIKDGIIIKDIVKWLLS